MFRSKFYCRGCHLGDVPTDKHFRLRRREPGARAHNTCAGPRLQRATINNLYTTLDKHRPQIRLLSIVSFGDGRRMLEFQMSTYYLDSVPPFMALSYVWGDPSANRHILINGKVVPVPVNLETALRHLVRIPGAQSCELSRAMPVWADAICINQDNVAERSEQVQLMRSIYTQATTVVAWLGEDIDGSMGQAMTYLDWLAQKIRAPAHRGKMNISWIQDCPDLIREDGADGAVVNNAWHAIHKFCRLQYWTRTWIVQEVALATNLVLTNGRSTLDSSSLRDALDWLYIQAEYANSVKPDCMPGSVWSYVFSDNWEGVFSILSLREMQREDPNYNLYANAQIYASRYVASDPRDQIFGLLGLFNLQMKPDYSKAVVDVYLEFVKEVVSKTRSIGFLAIAGLGVETQTDLDFGLPSWVPNMHALAKSRRFVPLAEESVGWTTKWHSRLPDPPSIHYHTLHAFGAAYDTIQSVDSRACHKADQLFSFCKDYVSILDEYPREQEYETFAHKYCGERIPRLQAVLRVILTERDPRSGDLFRLSRLPPGYSLSFLRFLASKQKRLSEDSFLKSLGIQSGLEFPRSMAKRFLPVPPAVQSSADLGRFDERNEFDIAIARHMKPLFKQRLFQTRRGYLGLGPRKLVRGDSICLLDGYHHPVALRRTGSRSVLVGPCFILDESLQSARYSLEPPRGNLRVERFEIE